MYVILYRLTVLFWGLQKVSANIWPMETGASTTIGDIVIVHVVNCSMGLAELGRGIYFLSINYSLNCCNTTPVE